MTLFLGIALLWHGGEVRLAVTTAQSLFILSLAGLAAVMTFGRPAQLRRARVPIRRALPPAWWPREEDTAPMLALCAGAPVVLAVGMAVYLFH